MYFSALTYFRRWFRSGLDLQVPQIKGLKFSSSSFAIAHDVGFHTQLFAQLECTTWLF